MTSWPLAALSAAACFTAHYLALRAATGRIADGLGALCIEASAALGLLALFALGVTPRGQVTPLGLAFACASGLAISAMMALLFTSIRLGAPVSSAGTIVMGGGLALAALIAPLLFGEGFTLRRAIGVLLGLAAMGVLASER